jgi:hypothetical protein
MSSGWYSKDMRRTKARCSVLVGNDRFFAFAVDTEASFVMFDATSNPMTSFSTLSTMTVLYRMGAAALLKAYIVSQQSSLRGIRCVSRRYEMRYSSTYHADTHTVHQIALRDIAVRLIFVGGNNRAAQEAKDVGPDFERYPGR